MKRSALAVAGVILAGLPGIAGAQQASAADTDHSATPTAPSSKAALLASSTASGPPKLGIEEVVVTAQRRKQNLQSVPITVEAVSGGELAKSGVKNVQDLKDIVPGISVNSTEGFETTHLRGVGSNTAGPGLENPVALYVDGVYYASSASSLLDFVDVSQVEVLKGPQGTLFGRNATGGLIQIITRDPSAISHTDIDVGYGNYDTVKADLYTTGAIADHLTADLAGEIDHQGDGYGRNLYNGQQVFKTDINAVLRSKWLYTPSADTRITAIFDYSQFHNNNLTNRLVPNTNPVPGTGPVYGGTPWDNSSDVNNFDKSHGGGTSLKIDQDLSFGHLMGLSAYRQSSSSPRFDIDDTSSAFEAIDPAIIREHQFSQELQASSLTGSPITWVAGLYYFNYSGKYTPAYIHFGGEPFDPIAPFSYIAAFGTQDISAFAGYAQASTEIFSKTNLTVGVRYSYERRTLDGSEQGLFSKALPGIDLANVRDAIDFNSPTYRVSLDHRFGPQLLVYASFNTGFKSGGFNTGSPTDPPFRPEFLKAYEAGVKTDFFDRRLRLNMSGFYYDYADLQEQKVELTATGIINGAGAQIYGVDLDFQARLTEALSLSGGMEYLHDRFTAFPVAPISTPEGGTPLINGSATGNHLPFTPDAVFNLKLAYTTDLANGSLDSSVTYAYNTGYYPEVDNVLHQSPYSTLNASVRWTSGSGRYSVTGWGSNLTNAVIAVGETNAIGNHFAQYNPPRTYGVTLGYHF